MIESTARTARTARHAARAVSLATATTLLGGLLTATASATPATTPEETSAAGGLGDRSVTLPTGERVLLDAAGRITGTRPAAGREDVPLGTVRTPRGSYVVPADAAPALASGELDPGLFQVTGPAADAAEPALHSADPEDGDWHDLTIEHLDRDGRPLGDYFTFLQGMGELAWEEPHFPHDDSGTVTLRVPAGSYVLTSAFFGEEGQDVLTRPQLDIDGDTTVTLDARVAQPVRFTVPDPAAQQIIGSVGFTLDRGPEDYTSFSVPVDPDGLRIGHVGPAVTDGELSQELGSAWTVPDGGPDYHLGYRTTGPELLTGHTRDVAREELAEVAAGLGASLPGKRGALYATPHLNPYIAGAFGSPPRSCRCTAPSIWPVRRRAARCRGRSPSTRPARTRTTPRPSTRAPPPSTRPGRAPGRRSTSASSARSRTAPRACTGTATTSTARCRYSPTARAVRGNRCTRRRRSVCTATAS